WQHCSPNALAELALRDGRTLSQASDSASRGFALTNEWHTDRTLIGQIDLVRGLSYTRFMATVNVHEAKTHFSKLLAQVSAGEEIIIAKAGKPVARLAPIVPKPVKKRVPGIDKGRVWMSADFDIMSKRELNDWYRGDSRLK